MNLLSKISSREKKFLAFGGIIVLAIIVFQGYAWYDGFNKRIDDFSGARLLMLEKQLNRISGKEGLEKHLVEMKQELEEAEKAILQGDKPPVAAAALSSILRDATSAQGVNIALERTLNPSDVQHYVAVPVEIGFTTTTERLKNILYSLRTSPFLLTVSEIKIRVINIANPTDIYTSLVVTGFIKKEAETAQENKEQNKANEKGVKNEAKDVT
jgi:type II secretory pathway component PulM